ncbi:hypothetical protein ABEB36_006068 [Hypothenemus hampei]|uniref:Chitin-binding type-4 domain-containing protein n=1 Tax=Hypothenemus hampei TaxID=57062 RepID=A0ABD1F319_HYPHA
MDAIGYLNPAMNAEQLLIMVICDIVKNKEVNGHGYMISPPNRASLWRIDPLQPINFNDNEYFCGGTHVQYYKNYGKCGPCGDNWRDPVPRSNENGGTYGNSKIVANYTTESVITVVSRITANHLGSLYFHLCELKNFSEPETEDCFQLLRLADGEISFQITSSLINDIYTRVQLPKNVVCERCVLRWHYRTGNSWGLCEDGTGGMGCGNQEIFRSCADISILPVDAIIDNNLD